MHDETLELLSLRYDILSALSERECERPTLVENLDQSRATVYRGIRSLEEAGLVEHGSDGYRLTTYGTVLLEAYEEFAAVVDCAQEAKALLNALPGSAAIPGAFIRHAAVVPATGPGSHAPATHIGEMLSDATRVRGLVKAHTQSAATDIWHRTIVLEETPTELVFDTEFYSYLSDSADPKVREILSSDHLDAYTSEDVPFGLLLLDTTEDADGSDCAVVIVYDETTTLRGLLRTSTDPAIEWAEDLYREYKRRPA